MKSQQRGFTLWELLMTLLVAGVLLGLGVPNVMQFQRAGAMTGVANDFVTGLLTARTEAVKRQVPVTMCLSDDPFANPPVCVREPVANSTRGFIVWADEDGNLDALGNPNLSDVTDGDAVVNLNEPILYRGAGPTGTIRVSTTCGHLTFNPNGWVRPGTGICAAYTATWNLGSTVRVVFCDDRGRSASAGGLSSARAIRIEGTGRGFIQQETVQVNSAITLTGATCP